MTGRFRWLSRIALFVALVYVVSWSMAALPNVNLAFFIIAVAGCWWGGAAGAVVGSVGLGLFSLLNPLGPALLPVTLAQVIGGGLIGILGVVARRILPLGLVLRTVGLVLLGTAVSLAFYVLVGAADAWTAQPFWPRFIGGLGFSMIGIVSNAIIFPLLFPAAESINKRML